MPAVSIPGLHGSRHRRLPGVRPARTLPGRSFRRGVQPQTDDSRVTHRHTLVRVLACAGLLIAPAAAAQQPAARTAPRQPQAAERTPATQDSTVVELARRQLGRRYLFGGTDPERGFDCSGYVRYIMRALGRETPRTSGEIARAGREVPRDVSQLRVGDILTFGNRNRVSHVGIYIGDGKYVHASSGAGRIVESRLDRPQSRLVKAWLGVRRFIAGDSTETVASAPR